MGNEVAWFDVNSEYLSLSFSPAGKPIGEVVANKHAKTIDFYLDLDAAGERAIDFKDKFLNYLIKKTVGINSLKCKDFIDYLTKLRATKKYYGLVACYRAEDEDLFDELKTNRASAVLKIVKRGLINKKLELLNYLSLKKPFNRFRRARRSYLIDIEKKYVQKTLDSYIQKS